MIVGGRVTCAGGHAYATKHLRSLLTSDEHASKHTHKHKHKHTNTHKHTHTHTHTNPNAIAREKQIAAPSVVSVKRDRISVNRGLI